MDSRKLWGIVEGLQKACIVMIALSIVLVVGMTLEMLMEATVYMIKSHIAL